MTHENLLIKIQHAILMLRPLDRWTHRQALKEGRTESIRLQRRVRETWRQLPGFQRGRIHCKFHCNPESVPVNGRVIEAETIFS
jgi:hypothetical protein